MKYLALIPLILTSCTISLDAHVLPSGEQKFTGNISIIPVIACKK